MKKMISLLLVLTMLLTCSSEALAAVKLPSELTVIDEESFSGTSSLDEVEIPEGTETIKSKAFANSAVQKIFIPDTVNYIAKDAFEGANVTIVSSGSSFAHFFALQHGIKWENADGVQEYQDITIENYESFLFPDQALEAIPVSDITDPEAVREIEEFNASLNELNGMIAEYNQNLRSMAENGKSLISLYENTSVEDTEDRISISGDDFNYTILGDAIELLDENASVVDCQDNGTMRMTSGDNTTFYLTAAYDRLFLTLEKEVPLTAQSNATPGERAIERTNTILSGIQTSVDAVQTLTTYLSPAVYKGFDLSVKYLDCYNPLHYKIQMGWWKTSDFADSLVPGFMHIDEAIDFLNPANIAVGIAAGITSVYVDQDKKMQIAALRRHGHPTDGELYEQAYQIVMEMLSDLQKAENLYTANQVGGFLGALLSAASAKGGRIGEATLKKLSALFLGMDIADLASSNKADAFLESARQKDALLHWAVLGYIKDEETGENLPYTVVTSKMGSYGQVEVVSSDGTYSIEPLNSTVELLFEKKGYEPKKETVSMQRDVLEIKNVTLKAKKGVVFGNAYDSKTKEMLSEVEVYTDDAEEPAVLTDDNGYYALTLPVKETKLTFKKGGYEDYNTSVTPDYKKELQADAPMTTPTPPPSPTPSVPPSPAAKTGIVQGYIKDASDGKPIAGAEISHDGATVVSNADGFYSIQLPIGEAELTVSKADYHSQSFSLMLNEEDVIPWNVSLQPLNGGDVTPTARVYGYIGWNWGGGYPGTSVSSGMESAETVNGFYSIRVPAGDWAAFTIIYQGYDGPYDLQFIVKLSPGGALRLDEIQYFDEGPYWKINGLEYYEYWDRIKDRCRRWDDVDKP